MSTAFPRGGICTLLLLGLLTGCNRQAEDSPVVGPRNPPPDYFKTHFQDESQFIVETILTDLAEMAAFAQRKQLPPEVTVAASERKESPFRQPSYDVKIVSGTQVVPKLLQVTRPIWSPELYEEFARALLGGNPAATHGQDKNDLSLLVALTDLRAATIETENQRISGLLQTNFTDPSLHEMAAVLLGTFALREFTDNFFDVRSPLCRMTAHLTMAKVLSGEAGAGINGRAAEAMLFTLMNNQKAALEKLTAIEAEPKLKPWVNALRVRNTYDYRDLKGARERTRLESVMYYVAISRCIRSDTAWEELPEDLLAGGSDFARIASAEQYSVALGHQLLELSLRLEMDEIAEIHSLVTGKKPSGNEEVVKFLNQVPERCVLAGGDRVRIIGPGQWAAFLQHHLCHALRHNFEFLQSKWGVREEASKFAAAMDERFGSLRLYPFVRRYNATTEQEYKQAVDEGQPVTVTTPHLVPADAWNNLANPPKFAGRYWPQSHPHVNEWFKHNPPPGTAYDPAPRLYHPSLVDRSDVARVFGELYELSPYDSYIADGLLWKGEHGQDNLQQAEKIFQPLLAYPARQNLHLATQAKGDPVRYEEIMVRYSNLNPAGYFTLGKFFADRKDDEKATAYYEKGVEQSKDEVLISNNCNWLVHHYFAKGQVETAEALADRVAEVYSSTGLRTKAELMEVEKKYDEAFEYYQRLEERYGQEGPLAGFCVRYKSATGDARYDAMVQKRIKALFPRGIERVGLKDFSSPPAEGVLIPQDSDSLRQAGLKKGDVIVALDGIRVYDMVQYQHVRDLTNAPLMRLVIWNGSEYTEKNASPPKRRFGLPFANYEQVAAK